MRNYPEAVASPWWHCGASWRRPAETSTMTTTHPCEQPPPAILCYLVMMLAMAIAFLFPISPACAQSDATVTNIRQGFVDLDSRATLTIYGGSGVIGVLNLQEGSSLIVHNSGAILPVVLSHDGAGLQIISSEKYSWAQIGTLNLMGGTTTIKVGEADDRELSVSRVFVEAIESSDDAGLRLSINGQSNVFIGEGASLAESNYDLDPRPVLSLLGELNLTSGTTICVGCDASSSEHSLRVAETGVLEIQNASAVLTAAAGTRIAFEPGAELWFTDPEVLNIDEDNGTVSVDTAALLTSLDIAEAEIEGEILTKFGTSGVFQGTLSKSSEGDLALTFDGIAYHGELRDMITLLYVKRNSLTMPGGIKKIFDENQWDSIEGASRTVVWLGLLSNSNGARERMASLISETSTDLYRHIDSARREGHQILSDDESEERLFKWMQDIPVTLEIKTGEAETNVNVPTDKRSKRERVDFTTISGSLVAGVKDWGLKFGFYGLFSTADSQWLMSYLRTNGETDTVLASVFALKEYDADELLFDISYAESEENVAVTGLSPTYESVGGIKRRIYSAGLMWTHHLFERDFWSLRTVLGLRAVRWEDVDTTLGTTYSRNELQTTEKGSVSGLATAGAILSFGKDFSWSGFNPLVAEYAPRRADVRVAAYATGLTSKSPDVSVSVPGVAGASGTLTADHLARFRWNADVTLGLQFPATRFEVSAGASRAGSRYESYSLGGKFAWTFWGL